MRADRRVASFGWRDDEVMELGLLERRCDMVAGWPGVRWEDVEGYRNCRAQSL